MATPVVVAGNGIGVAVINVTATKPLLGMPVTIAANGRGMPVVVVAADKPGIPITVVTVPPAP